MEAGVAAGIALHRVFSVTNDEYKEKTFRSSLNALLTDGTVALISSVYQRHDDGYGHECLQRIAKLPPAATLTDNQWFIDSNGEPVFANSKTKHQYFLNPRLYIKEDGLPRKVRFLFESPSKIRASDIIATMHVQT